MMGLGVVAVGGLGLMMAISRRNTGPKVQESSPGNVTAKAVSQRMAEALATGDPRTIRAEAKLLRAEGYLTQADALERSAQVIEGELAAGSTPPLPPKAPPPPGAKSQPTTGTGGSSGPLLKVGSRGAAVTSLQARLNGLGYDVGKADGVFGAKTKAGVMAFQRDAGLAVDGIVGPRTAAALLSPTTPVASTL